MAFSDISQLMICLFVCQILDGLYLGNFRDSRDVNQLKDNNITHIVSVHDNARPLNPVKHVFLLLLILIDICVQLLLQLHTTGSNIIP